MAGSRIKRLNPHMSKTPSAILITDGDCGFCQTSAAFLLRHFSGDWVNAPSQTIDFAMYGLSEVDVNSKVWFVLDGVEGAVQKWGGAQAVAKLLLHQPKPWIKPLAALAFVPGIKQIADLLYKLISRNRGRLPGATDACAIPPSANEIK